MYFLTGQGIDADQPDQSKFDINRTSGEIFVLKVRINIIACFSKVTKKKIAPVPCSPLIVMSLTVVPSGALQSLRRTTAETASWDMQTSRSI